MQIVTDSGTDVNFNAGQLKDYNVHILPLTVTLDGKSYKEGVDIKTEDFYQLMEQSENLPLTSQPSVGEFAQLYRELAKSDPDILSIHISSGLSGTSASARAAAEMTPEANVTVVDSLSLSVPSGWQVEAAARAARAGWEKANILALIKRIADSTDVIYTLKELKYLIHGGRISHLKGLLASMLNIKPMIGVEKQQGTYISYGQARSFSNALKGLGEYVNRKVHPGSALRIQVVHASNPDGAQTLIDDLSQRFVCRWEPVRQLSLVLGAHVGRSMVGVAFAPAEIFDAIP
ncbi:MAG TPA: DegV family protein [Anaerolineaceae bacterium]|nr:DegV family protein [Anaerolineaceae bacterium]